MTLAVVFMFMEQRSSYFTTRYYDVCSGGSSVSQNKLPQLILGYIYNLKYLQSNFIGRFYSFEIHNL